MVDVGRVGVWSIGLRNDDPSAANEIREAAAELEELGYGAIWLGGSPDVRHAVPLLEATSRIVVATGILNIWEHDAADVADRQKAVSSAHPGRFLLGLGASHATAVKDYAKPYSAMARYLDGLDAAGAPPSERVLAALGPRMLELARDRTAGAHPYLVTPEHTERARQILGPDRLLAPEVKVVLDTDPGRARATARAHLGFYMQLPNYTNNLLRLGFTEDDVADGGSDRLVDAVVAWGDVEAVRRRVAAHRDAGADHATLQVLTGDRNGLPRAEWRELAAGLDLR
ncbi:LLM class F420-dependent oxidoreductase [Actinoallomurus rhizosphaericola]|uniref:LLM class F420-dependent oxidoreductase n=1 Tax=Actinoallomurus rhizosphaericola TaxID=2952536 RepID=UPI002090EE71|nr:LLM class F420-dependent oxidoreductase [Actinoallomurus rhizosphaericola]MCO5992444.1 LLM class F420-dependent oxidoreductase [Actinoallomurus rhizosphaericola]